MTPSGVLTTLVSFTGALNGSFPAASLVRGSDGNFYGTTNAGGSSNNGVVFQLVIPQAAAPVFSLSAGAYMSAQTAMITSATSGATIRYTTDDSTPSETNGTVYTGPVSINSTTTLAAIAYESGFSDSAVTSNAYMFTTPTMGYSGGGGGGYGGGAPSYWFYLSLAVLAAARYAQTRNKGRWVGP